MKIAANCVVSIDYVLKNDAGEILDQSTEGDALTYLHGHDQIVNGLEAALDGKAKGDNVKAVVSPKDGYGERTTDEMIQVPKAEFPPGVDLEPGEMIVAASNDGNEIPLWVVDVDESSVMLSHDHPLAGETLHFDVTVKDVRAATAEELQHGHVHGPGEHHHH